MHDLDQILLRLHHRVDRFVSGRRFVDHIRIFTAFHVRSRLEVIVQTDATLRLGAAHHPAGTVAAAVEAVGIAEAAYDETLRAHAARNDAQLTLARAHRALSGHQHILADPRHDTNFSLGFYALACLSEICMGLNSRIISGRLLVRTITEVRINLAYLAHKDDKDMWARFRSYGSGQAKLALLKYEEIKSDQPILVCIETLKALANEDFFQEFVNIDLGSWSGSDLRKMAEECGAKGDYDRFYGWTSAFVHGQWAAARDAVFCTCLNPLHRAHRGPMPYQRPMESCTADAVFLINSIFSTIDECYPGLAFRLSSN